MRDAIGDELGLGASGTTTQWTTAAVAGFLGSFLLSSRRYGISFMAIGGERWTPMVASLVCDILQIVVSTVRRHSLVRDMAAKRERESSMAAQRENRRGCGIVAALSFYTRASRIHWEGHSRLLCIHATGAPHHGEHRTATLQLGDGKT